MQGGLECFKAIFRLTFVKNFLWCGFYFYLLAFYNVRFPDTNGIWLFKTKFSTVTDIVDPNFFYSIHMQE